jgi:hypothetical protein
VTKAKPPRRIAAASGDPLIGEPLVVAIAIAIMAIAKGIID